MRRKIKDLKQEFIRRYYPYAGNISKIARDLGISRVTFYNWMKNDKKFKEAIDEEIEGMIDFAESKLFALIDEKNLGAICFFLKTKAKHRGYVERTEIAGSEESPVKVQVEVIYTDKRPEE